MSKFNEGFALIQDVIKLKWVPEILEVMNKGKDTFSDILDSVPYLSPTELNRKLKVLQEREIIYKEEEGNYVLLDFGHDLLHIFMHLQELNERYHKAS